MRRRPKAKHSQATAAKGGILTVQWVESRGVYCHCGTNRTYTREELDALLGYGGVLVVEICIDRLLPEGGS